MKRKKGGKAAEEVKSQVQVVMNAMTISSGKKEVIFKEEIGVIHVEVDDGMRRHAYSERRRPVPRPKDWVTTSEARAMINVRDRLRAIRFGNELAAQTAPKVLSETGHDTPLVTHASSASLIGEVRTGARRWVIGSDDSVTKREHNISEEI